MLSELESMNSIASLALTSAENTAASVNSPSQGGITFVITNGMTAAIYDIVRFGSTENGNTAVTLLLGTEPIIVITNLIDFGEIDIVPAGLCFLQANDISRVGFQPIHKSLGHGCPDSINIITDDPHGKMNDG